MLEEESDATREAREARDRLLEQRDRERERDRDERRDRQDDVPLHRHRDMSTKASSSLTTGIPDSPLNPRYSFETFVIGSSNRFAHAAAEASARHGKPVLVATELAFADPENSGPRAVRESGRLAYLSADRAVRALEHLWTDAHHRARRAATAVRA